MNWFNNMPIFKKVGLIFVLSVVIFAVNLTISIVAMNKNRDTLDFMQHKVTERVELANQNVIFIQRLDELYTQAVSFADEDLLENASKVYQSLDNNLAKLISIDANQSQSLSELSRGLKEYNSMTSDLASSMLDGSIDMSQVGQISQKKSQVFERLTAGISQYKADKVDEFSSTVAEASDRSEQSLYLSVGIGIALLLLMIVATIAIARSISSSAGDVANSLGELADGKGDLRHQLKVAGTDELGQVSSNFNRFLHLLAESIQGVVNVTNPLLSSAKSLKEKMSLATQATQQQSQDARIVQVSMEEMRHSVNDKCTASRSSCAIS